MSTGEWEVDVFHHGVRLRWTVDTDSEDVGSPEFLFQGGGWILEYYKEGTWVPCYGLRLLRCSVVSPRPFHVSVHVEGSEDGRTVDVLPEERRFRTEFEEEGEWLGIWWKNEDDVLRSVPEFRPHGPLTLIVVLRVERGDSQPKASHTEWSVAGQSGSTRSTSVQTTLLMNELRCLESLTTDLDRLRLDDSHQDVEFHCAGHTTRAHGSIVCHRSLVIASMLSTDMVERRTGVVSIPNMAPDIFAQFLRYLYSGRLEDLTFDTALALYEAGDQYEVLGLARRCSGYLMDNLSVDNACEALVVFDAHNDGECVEKVVDFIVENRVPLVSEEWSAFCDEHSKLANKVLNRVWKLL